MLPETERLRLREYTPDDLDALYEILSDPETMRHYPAPYSREKTARWIAWSLENYARYGFGLWARELKADGTFLGDCGLTMQCIDGETLPEIGYHVHWNHWRRGYAREAGRAVRDWAFRSTDFPALYSYMNRDNQTSRATAASIGLRQVKTFEDPRYGPMCVYALRREEWEARYAGLSAGL